MIILAAAIILALNSSNLTSKANWAKVSSDRANLQAEYVSVLAKAMSDKVDGKASMVKVSELKETPEYKAWAQKVTDAGFTVEEPADDNDPAAIRVVTKLSEAQLTAYGLEYDEANNEVVGYDWVINKDAKIKVDGVLIPEGFVASIYEGEMTKEEGLVIYETDSLEGINHETAMTTYNQYVWVPVPNISEFVRRDGYSNDALQTYVSGGNATEPFSKGTLSSSNDLTREYAEYAKTIQSVETNGGFYIARYEAGKDGTGTVVSKKNATVWSSIKWGTSMTYIGTEGAVYRARSIYPESANKEVVSTLIYGVQWDAVMKFMEDVENSNVEGKKYIENSTGMGWYSDNYSSGNAAHKTGIDVDEKASNKVKNIYDMAGNMYEWTMEANDTSTRVLRGGYYSFNGNRNTASFRFGVNPITTNTYGFRVALYLRVPAES